MSIKVFLAEDHNLVREAIHLLLEKETDIKVVGEAADGQTTLEAVRHVKPDVVIMDIAMPILNGIETTRKISTKFHEVKVIALSAHSERRFVLQMFRAGAVGYVLKDCAFKELICALRTVIANNIYISSQIATIVMEDYINQSLKKDSSAFSVLTDREREVLQLITEGNATKQIALLLEVSVKTIETHRLQIMEKLKIYSIAELTKYAIREGLTSL